MPYANNQGIRIHYEVEGEGPPLVLQHGLTHSVEFWRIAGFVEPLKGDYQLILVDARGHGASDKPHDPEAYRLALVVSDVVAVLDDLNISKAHFLGYSMGGLIGWGIAKYAPERFYSLIIGGASPYGHAPEGLGSLDRFKQGMEAYLAAIKPRYGKWWTPEVKATLSANDLEALIAVASGQAQDIVSLKEDIEDFLPAITVPCLLFGGEVDAWYAGAEECARHMPNATVISLPGLDHFEAFFRIDLVLPHIRKFLAEVGEG